MNLISENFLVLISFNFIIHKSTSTEVKRNDDSDIIMVEKLKSLGNIAPDKVATNASDGGMFKRRRMTKRSNSATRTNNSFIHFWATMLSVIMRKGVINTNYARGNTDVFSYPPVHGAE